QEELGPLVPLPGDSIGHGRREGQRGGRRPGHRRRAKREGFAAGHRASASIPAVARHPHTAPSSNLRIALFIWKAQELLVPGAYTVTTHVGREARRRRED